MSSTDLNIFTNADSVKMIDRIKTVLSHADFFDCLDLWKPAAGACS